MLKEYVIKNFATCKSLCNLQELYTTCKEKHPNVNIGFSKFCVLIPKWRTQIFIRELDFVVCFLVISFIICLVYLVSYLYLLKRETHQFFFDFILNFSKRFFVGFMQPMFSLRKISLLNQGFSKLFLLKSAQNLRRISR